MWGGHSCPPLLILLGGLGDSPRSQHHVDARTDADLYNGSRRNGSWRDGRPRPSSPSEARRVCHRRVVLAFDLSWLSNPVSALSFAHFSNGGNREPYGTGVYGGACASLLQCVGVKMSREYATPSLSLTCRSYRRKIRPK